MLYYQPEKRNTVNNYDHESDNLDEWISSLKDTIFQSWIKSKNIWKELYTKTKWGLSKVSKADSTFKSLI